MARLIKALKKKIFSLRFSILSIFISSFLLVISLIIWLVSEGFSNSIAYTAFELMQASTVSVVYKISDSLKPIEVQNSLTAKLISTNIITANEESIVSYGYNLLKTIPLVQSVFWANEQGQVIIADKHKDNSITSSIYQLNCKPQQLTLIKRNTAGEIISTTKSIGRFQDPRQQSWYLETKKERKTYWSKVFKFLYWPHELGTGTLSPVYNQQGQLIGEFGLVLTLNYLSDYLSKKRIGKNGFSFILDTNDKLIAFPHCKPFTDLPSNNNQLMSIHQPGLQLIEKSRAIYQRSGKAQFSFQDAGETYLASYEPVTELKLHGWLIGSIVAEKEFTGPLEAQFFVLLILCFFVAFINIFLISGLIHLIVKPLKKIVHEINRIKNFEIEDSTPIKSHIREVIDLQSAMESMKLGLKSFQKYVPKGLVQKLIETGLDVQIGGERKELVVLFTDIRNFTTIAERVDPNQLLMQICEYFEELSGIIIEEGGTIDKYIGDSIMAFWGAPIIEDDPCYKAARAAIKCQKKLDQLNQKWLAEGKVELITRVGIHAGEALVGNVGSSWRFNYTALGDSVNIASRLEKINKDYETRIIVSHAVYKKIKDRMQLRLIDYVFVRGRIEGDHIYELLADNDTTLPFDLKAYVQAFKKGFKAYQAEEWTLAIQHFEVCLTIYPEDHIAALFIKRANGHE
jgi:adenylate cyclase